MPLVKVFLTNSPPLFRPQQQLTSKKECANIVKSPTQSSICAVSNTNASPCSYKCVCKRVPQDKVMITLIKIRWHFPFTNVVAVFVRIKQGVRSGRVSMPIEKKCFKDKMKEVKHIKSGNKGKKNQLQSYHTSSLPSKIANINLNSSFPTNKPES